jgi:uncharacterized protein YsxB (DUF464 family)
MIEVKFKSKNNSIISFSINNHALIEREAIMAGEAYDMVCNSVSVLSQSVIIGLDEVLKLNVSYEIKNGFLSLDLTEFNEEEIEAAQVLLKTFKLSLDSVIISLEKMFGNKKRMEYINLLNEEV